MDILEIGSIDSVVEFLTMDALQMILGRNQILGPTPLHNQVESRPQALIDPSSRTERVKEAILWLVEQCLIHLLQAILYRAIHSLEYRIVQ